VGSYLGAEKPAVVVVPAGEEAEASADAARSLLEALRGSGKARLVMDARVLGSVGALDDEAIVRKAAKLPVQLVAVVRVFTTEDAPDTVVVTFYKKGGKATAALSTERGKATASLNEDAAGQGVSSKAAGAVSKVLGEKGDKPRTPAFDKPEDKSPVGQYKRRHIGFSRFKWIGRGGVEEESWGEPYLGDGKNSLELLNFYGLVGQQEMIDRYHLRGRFKLGLIISGTVTAVAGVIMVFVGAIPAAMTDYENCISEASWGGCDEWGKHDADWTVFGVGMGSLAVGIGAMVVGIVLDRRPTTREEEYRFAAEHNRALRKKLGLPDKPDEDLPRESQQGAQATPPRVALSPIFSSQGGGLGMRIDF